MTPGNSPTMNKPSIRAKRRAVSHSSPPVRPSAASAETKRSFSKVEPASAMVALGAASILRMNCNDSGLGGAGLKPRGARRSRRFTTRRFRDCVIQNERTSLAAALKRRERRAPTGVFVCSGPTGGNRPSAKPHDKDGEIVFLLVQKQRAAQLRGAEPATPKTSWISLETLLRS